MFVFSFLPLWPERPAAVHRVRNRGRRSRLARPAFPYSRAVDERSAQVAGPDRSGAIVQRAVGYCRLRNHGPAGLSRRCATPAVPYVVGQWVRGGQFYGRGAILRQALDGPRRANWLVGTRRIGKTSILRQLELLTGNLTRGYLPIFCDLQGIEDGTELNLALGEALLDAEERLRRIDLDPTGFTDSEPTTTLRRLRDALRPEELDLLLLCDGAEALVTLEHRAPQQLRSLRRTLTGDGAPRSVLAATAHLSTRCPGDGELARLLDALPTPLFARPLEDDAAIDLIAQSQADTPTSIDVDSTTTTQLRERSGGHPYLLQMLCYHYAQTDDLAESERRVRADDTVVSMFTSDLRMLPPAELAVLVALRSRGAAGGESIAESAGLEHGPARRAIEQLERLGLLKRDRQNQLTLGNSIFEAWLAATPDAALGLVADVPQTAARGASGNVTEIVAGLSSAGGQSSPQQLFAVVYDPLRELAERYLRRERRGHTLQPTALVHEAYLRLIDQSRVDWRGRTHFYAVGANIMRRLLVDHARSRRRTKRGGDRLQVTLTGLAESPGDGALDRADLLSLHRALEELASTNERQARVVELRFFGGLTMSEIATALGVSRRTVDGDWAAARVRLAQLLAE